MRPRSAYCILGKLHPFAVDELRFLSSIPVESFGGQLDRIHLNGGCLAIDLQDGSAHPNKDHSKYDNISHVVSSRLIGRCLTSHRMPRKFSVIIVSCAAKKRGFGGNSSWM